MTVKECVIRYLDAMKDGEELQGWQLQAFVKARTGKNVYPDSALRKLRLVRKEADYDIICIDNKKSKYIKKSCRRATLTAQGIQ